MNRDFKGVWIPRIIWENRELTWGEKLLFLEIDSLAKNGECFASNDHFAEFLAVSTRQVQKYLSALQSKGFIKIQLFYKGNTKIVSKRIIYTIHKFTDEQKFTHTDEQKFAHMDEGLFARTDEQKFVDSNTQSFSNTINNTSSKNIKKVQPKPDYKKEFDALWAMYPKKVSKEKAYTAYIKARKDKKYEYETIEIGLKRYIDYLNITQKERDFILNGSTFFNQARFMDEYNVVGLKQKPKNALQAFNMAFGEEQQNEYPRSRKNVGDYPDHLQEPFQGF